jgi:UDP-glucuronate 4-epimerase
VGSWLVTGGVGFIGYHVTRALAARGDSVVVADDFSDAPYPKAMKDKNAADLAGIGRVRVVRACVTDPAAMRPLFTGVTGVLHLAGLAGVRPSFRTPARYARVNVEGTANMLELALEHGVTNFAFASSSSVYGNATPLPACEDAPAVAPESPYAASKRGAELVSAAIAKRAPSLACTALRFFTVYGPRQRPEMAISLFTRAALEGTPVTLFGDGSMRRDFTHVDDIVRGVLSALDAPRPGWRALNLGSGSPITLTALIAAIDAATGKPLRVETGPVPLGDVDATFADITRASTELGWSPRVRLAEGLASVVDWLRGD